LFLLLLIAIYLVTVLVVHRLLLLLNCCTLLLRLSRVAPDVKGREHVGEEGRVEGEQDADGLRVVAARLELNLYGVAEHDEELNLAWAGECAIINLIKHR
jgi:hypothetical protein